MRALLVYLLVGILIIGPARTMAQSDEEPEPGPKAASVLPKAEVFGKGWTESAVISPDVIQEYGFTMSPDVFKEGAAGLYLGPNGTRAIIVSFILTDNRIAIRKSWEDASDLMGVINYPVSTDYERDQELESMPAPEGCLEAKRVEGVEKTFHLPSGSTLCAVDDISLLLVTIFGDVNGASGVDASDAVVSAVTIGATPSASGGKETQKPASDGAGATEIALTTMDIKFEPKELTIPANTDVTITVTNDGVLQHDFAIEDQGIESGLLNTGESADVVVNLPPGTYRFVCTVPGHKEAGMVGTLIVE
jgi:uncharacterized cupredoxin-like copper-binding protein